MEPSTQKLIHTFGALADLGQEIAGTGDFNEMVRTSMHLLLGTLALRRGAVVECNGPGPLRCVRSGVLMIRLLNGFEINEAEMKSFLGGEIADSLVQNTSSSNPFLGRYREKLAAEGIELVLPMIVRGESRVWSCLAERQVAKSFRARISRRFTRWSGTSASAFTRIACSNKWPNARKRIAGSTMICARSIAIPCALCSGDRYQRQIHSRPLRTRRQVQRDHRA